MSDTPRTDAHTRQLIDILQHPHWIEFARTLERETVSLRNDLDALQHTLRGIEVQEERLERENAALLKRLEASDGWDDYSAIKALKTENAKLRADKERLDWFVEQIGWTELNSSCDPKLFRTDDHSLLDSWRAALDAARKEQP